MSLTAEMRVGMSVYWVKLTEDANGWCAAWTRDGRALEVSRSTKQLALAEAHRICLNLDAKEVVRT